MFEATQRAEQLDVGFVPAPSGGSLCVISSEDGRVAHALLIGFAPDLRPDAQRIVAVVSFAEVAQSTFGYPNEDAFRVVSRDVGPGVFELMNSGWKAKLEQQNQAIV